MATIISSGDCFALRAWTVLGNQAAVNTWNFNASAVSGAIVTDQDVCTNFDAAIDTLYKNTMPPTATYRGVQFYFTKKTGGLPNYVFSTANAGPGIVGTTPAPRQSAGILQYEGFLRGPKHRGRVFIPFPAVDQMDADGSPLASYVTFLDSFATLLLSPITVTSGAGSVSLNWIIPHKGSPFTFDFVLTARGVKKFATMKKRGDYGRVNTSPI